MTLRKAKRSVWWSEGDKPKARVPTYDFIKSQNTDSESDKILQGSYMLTFYLIDSFITSQSNRDWPLLAKVSWWRRLCNKGREYKEQGDRGSDGGASPFIPQMKNKGSELGDLQCLS